MDRYTLSKSKEELSDRFIIEKPESYEPSYNIFPSRLVPVITLAGKGGFSWFYWGVHPELSKNKSLTPKLYNTTVSEIETRLSLKNTLQTSRCIVPADGYYCWKKVSKKGAIPYRVVRSDESAFSFAGIWEEYEDTSGNMVHTFRIITVASPPSMSHLGDTVPVILDENTEGQWLDPDLTPDELLPILTSYQESDLHIYTVSSRISNNSIDAPDLVLPAPAADQFGNYSLFD